MTNPNPSPAYQPDALYFVRSDRNPNLFYTVGQAGGRCACGQRIGGLWHCQCPDHIHRARDCKHVRAVVAGSVRPATVKATAAAATPRRLPIDDMDGAAPFSVDDFYSDAGAAIRRSVATMRAAVSA